MSANSQSERVAQLFDTIADEYDATGVDFFIPIANGLIGAVQPLPGERALDIGCGRGAVLVPLAQHVAPNGHATGIDLSPRMVQLAVDSLRANNVHADVQVGDAMSPQFGAESFDLITSSLVLFFLPDPAAALRAWRELLSVGGRLGVSTFGAYDDRWRDTVDGALIRHADDASGDARTSGAAGPFSSDAGMEALLRGAGYRDVRTVHKVLATRFDDPEHWFRWSMSVGTRQFWQKLPADKFDDVKAEILHAASLCRQPDGRIGFDQVVRYTVAFR